MTDRLIPVYRGDAEERPGFVGDTEAIGQRIVGFRGASAVQSFRYQASSTPGLAAPGNAARRTITVKNEGANDVFIGGEDVTINNGYRLASGDALTLELSGELWVVTASTNEDVYMIAEVDG